MSLLELFVQVDDFFQAFDCWAAQQQLPGKAKRGPEPSLSASEVMTIVIHFHQANFGLVSPPVLKWFTRTFGDAGLAVLKWELLCSQAASSPMSSFSATKPPSRSALAFPSRSPQSKVSRHARCAARPPEESTAATPAWWQTCPWLATG